MTKEAILASLQKENPSSIPTFKAMDAWAKYQAINFMKSEDAKYNQLCSDQTYEQMYQQYIDNQFIEQQNKDNEDS